MKERRNIFINIVGLVVAIAIDVCGLFGLYQCRKQQTEETILAVEVGMKASDVK